MQPQTKNRVLMTLLITILLWISGVFGYFYLFPIVTHSAGLKYTVRPGTTTKSLVEDLYQKQIIHNPILFNILIHLKGNAVHKLKAGQYLFPKWTTPNNLIDQITAGKGMIYYSFTIVNGWKFHDLLDALQHEEKLKHLTMHLNNLEIMNALGLPNEKPEGQFYPATYYFFDGSSDLSLLRRAYHLMQKKLNDAWQNRDPNLPYKKPYDSLIAASLVEKEAYLNEERPLIAGVLINRLEKHMLLQFDPSVIYGMGDKYKGKITRQDLLKVTPYNTYTNRGLPPTPIALPSVESILAVLHPAKHDYYYFVARGNGAHQFSRTLKEHNAAVTAIEKHHVLPVRVSEKNKNEFFNWHLVQKYILELVALDLYEKMG